MSRNSFSQYVLFFEAQHPFYSNKEYRTYTLLMPRCSPDNLSLKEDLQNVSDRFGTKFDVSLLLQLKITKEPDGNTQYTEIKKGLTELLKDYWISPMNHGMWTVETEHIKNEIFTFFEQYDCEIISIWGDWKEEFTDAVFKR